MKNTPNTTDRMASIFVLVATLLTIAFNGLAAAGYVNDVTPAAISAKYPTVLTPAGYAFSIWSLIYVGMMAFSIYQLLPNTMALFRRVRPLYLASCFFNCAWIYAWHYEYVGTCLVIILLLLACLMLICWRLRDSSSYKDALLSTAPFGLYFGWVTCATLINLTIFLGTVGVDAQSKLLGIVLIVLAAALAALVRWKLANFFYPLAVAWALGAIAVKQSGNTAIVVACAFATVACLVIAGSVVTTLKDSTSEQG